MIPRLTFRRSDTADHELLEMLGDRSVGEWRRPVYGRCAGGVETVDFIKDIIANHGDTSMHKISMHRAGGAADVGLRKTVGSRA